MAPEKLSHSCCGVKHAARTGSSDTYSDTIKGVRAVIISMSAGETWNGQQERASGTMFSLPGPYQNLLGNSASVSNQQIYLLLSYGYEWKYLKSSWSPWTMVV